MKIKLIIFLTLFSLTLRGQDNTVYKISNDTVHVQGQSISGVGSLDQEYNFIPYATSVSVSGTYHVDSTLTLNYTYGDKDSDAEGTSTFKWYRANDTLGTGEAAISGATSQTYTLVEADDGKWVSGEGGNLLGDVNSDIIVRHVHDIVYNENNDAWYCAVGDLNTESRFIKFTYEGDTLKPEIIATYEDGGRFKMMGLNIVNDSIIWVSDDTYDDDFGVFKSKISEITDTTKHIKLLSLNAVGHYLKRSGNNFLLLSPNKEIYISINNGNTFNMVDNLKYIAKNSGIEHETYSGLMPLQNGYFHIYTKSTEYDEDCIRGTSLIIKQK
ncbi:hypothetical protein JW960_26160 [candidate division KSB1 bacterium]|nr:hypothetical protein [candidate division KSB1 bacterium]